MKRRFNYTGRKKIAREKVKINLVNVNDQIRSLKADIELDGNSYPPDSKVYLEAYHKTDNKRFDLGPLDQHMKVDNLSLEEITYLDKISFRVMVVSEKMEIGKIYGHADGIKPENKYERKSILPVDFSRDLGQQIWKLEFNDDPTLYLNNQIFSIEMLAKSDPLFFMYVYPAVIKEILMTMIFAQGVDDVTEPTYEWQSSWLSFAKKYLLNEKIPDSLNPSDPTFDKALAIEWIEKVVEEFCYSRHEWNEFLEKIKGETHD